MSSKKTKFEKHAESKPLAITAEFSIRGADQSGGDGAGSESVPTFAIEAYSGAAIRQAWSRVPMVVDLAGLQASNVLPVLYAHDSDPYNAQPLDGVMGQSTATANNGRSLSLTGEMIGEGPTFDRVMRLARRGMKFQASIGADIQRSEFVEAGNKVVVNGREFAGPISVVRASSLREVSIVLMGADPNTSAAIAAEASEDFDMADNATEPTNKVEAGADGAAGKITEPTTPQVAIQADTSKLTEALKAAEAKADELTKRVELAEKRLNRGPAIHATEHAVDGDKVVEAALSLNSGLPQIEKHYDERTLEAAGKIRKGFGLQELLLRAAKAGGYSGSENVKANLLPILQAAFATHAISQILEAAVNKQLLQAFNAVERVWPSISAVRSVSDFKAINLYRLNGSFKFSKVGNAGELKVAQASDQKRSLAAETYGVLSSITRQDIINDDLSALSAVPARIGRGAALSLNELIWAEFEANNATYFQAATPGAGNALSYASLEAAVTAYRRLKDPDGNPLGITPRILMVPPELEPRAAQLMTQSALIATSLGSTSSKAVEPQANVFAGRYQVVSSSYLTSTSTWWLMADAADLAAMDVVFLNGQQTPTVEQTNADFNRLGVEMRGYFDLGVAKGESLSCIRMATA